MSVEGSDTGVATYVGGDMYVGGKENSNLDGETGPAGTYAVEAEGLTVVNGSLAMHPLKDAWKVWNSGTTGGKHYTSRGFRWGVVGFGSQFRPASGQTALVVGGNTDTSVMGSKGFKVGAWGAPGWLGKMDANDTSSHEYKASLAGSKTSVWGSNDSIDSVRGLDGNNVTEGDITPTLGIDGSLVTWNQSGNLSNVNGTDYSAYKSKISKLSEDLNTGTKLPATGTVAEGNAPSADDSYTIYKYDYRKNGSEGNSFTFYDGQLSNEKLITFTSTDPNKAMQVFNLPASYLDSSGHTGIDFKFVNIPDNASVVINVTGAQNQTINFHNGWRFWWNNENIANDFVTAATDDTDYAEQKKKNDNYAKRAQQIMWNFADASQVIIRGGQATGKIQVSNHNGNPNTNHGAWGSTIDGEEGVSHDMQATDDPSAAWMGSILVPNGNLQSHVSTNGRVWVGGDFEMLNNETVKRAANGLSNDGHRVGEEFINESGEKTTSILDMDQERHNLPWNGQMTANCPAIQWNKANSDGESLSGTTWNVYGTLEAAKDETSSLGTITDGEFTDGNDVDGTIKFEGVAKSAKYFVKEFATNSTEYTKVNPYIYQINTGDDERTYTNIAHVYDANGNEITGTNANKKLTDSNAIINEKEGATLEWSKVDASGIAKVLSGSEWQLQKNGSNEAYQITDSTKAVDKVTIQYNGDAVPTDGIPLIYNVAVDLTAIVTDTDGDTDGVPQSVKWSSSDPTVASVNDGTVLGLKNGTATITACSVADSAKCATVDVQVTGAPADTKNTTTFYFKADDYTSGNTYLRYKIGDGTFTGTTDNPDMVLQTASDCTDWLSVTIPNSGLQKLTFLFHGPNNGAWYKNHSNEDFTVEAGHSVVTVSDHIATFAAPSGCSTGGGSTTTGTVTITGDSVVSLGKTITLTAAPDSNAGTIDSWSSGDISILEVTANTNDKTTAIVKGLKATSRPISVTVKTTTGATASVTITVRDDSTINVYFQKSTVNWGEYYLHYQPKTGTNWPAVKMTEASDCSGYVVASIPKANVAANHGYYFRNGAGPDSNGWYNSNGQNVDGDPFTFWSGTYTDMYVNTNSDKQPTKPRGCWVASSAAKVRARVSTAALKSSKTDVIAVNDAEGSGTSAAPIVYSCGDALGKCDMDTKAGYFKVVDLADGTYTLTETVAPNGYSIAGPYTVTITTTNGVTSVSITNANGDSIANNKIPNIRNTGTISWNKISSDSANTKKLGGSEWKLTKTQSFGWNAATSKAEYTDIDTAQQQAITITDCKSGEGKACSASEGQTIYDVDPVEGQFKLKGLEWGTYTLVETKAPDGYDIDSTVRKFTFGPATDTDGTGQWNSNGVTSAAGDATGDFTTSSANYDSSVFNFSVGGIKNQPGVVLPGTGGAGDYWIYAAALVAALIGVVAAGMALKVRRRQ